MLVNHSTCQWSLCTASQKAFGGQAFLRYWVYQLSLQRLFLREIKPTGAWFQAVGLGPHKWTYLKSISHCLVLFLGELIPFCRSWVFNLMVSPWYEWAIVICFLKIWIDSKPVVIIGKSLFFGYLNSFQLIDLAIGLFSLVTAFF